MKRNTIALYLLLALSLLLSSSLPIHSLAAAPAKQDFPEGTFVVRIFYQDAGQIQLLDAFDLFEYNNHAEKYVLAAVDQADVAAIQALGFRVALDQAQTSNFKGRPEVSLFQANAIPGYACYRTVEETYQTAQDIVSAHPTLATWIDVGDSWEKAVGPAAGYDMMVLKLTNSAITGEKPKLFITASLHAREYTPAELATRFAEYLINNYDVDADVTWLLDHHEIHLMLQANPDGRKKAEAAADWRKNTDNDDGCSSGSFGTDLNRNFSYQWGTGGSSANACDTTYRGPSAGSEPETLAVQNYIKAIFSDQRGTGNAAAPANATGIYLDLHSAAGLVIWPWGYSTSDPPNVAQLRTLGRKFAYFNNYTANQIADQLYIASGGSVDFSYGELGIASIAFELGNTFFEPCANFTGTIYPNNLPALIYAAKVARTPYQTPLGPDALSLALSRNNVSISDPVTLTATINDTRYRGATESTQNIAAAEYYIDTPPWQAGAVAFSMPAVDGSFNAKTENVTAVIDTADLNEGRHTIFVRGQDAGGNWGAFSAIFLSLIPTSVELISFTGSAANDAVQLAWETAAEMETLGFNLYRATSADGERIKLNAEMIWSKVPPGSSFGATYDYLDATVEKGHTYYYWLEDENIYGEKALVGPISVPFPPDLISFTASAEGEDARLAWVTGNEYDNQGFNLYRSAHPGGEKVKLNAELIPSKVPQGSSGGDTYDLLDTGVEKGITYDYWLEMVDVSQAARQFGPLTFVIEVDVPPTPTPTPPAAVWRMYLPAVRLDR